MTTGHVLNGPRAEVLVELAVACTCSSTRFTSRLVHERIEVWSVEHAEGCPLGRLIEETRT